jgi:O-antigen/teichoic acid export membrane protein
VDETELAGVTSIYHRLPMLMIWALAGQAISSVTRLITSIAIGGRFGHLVSSGDGIGSPEQLGYYSNAFGVMMLLVGIHEAFVTTPLTVFNQKRHVDDNKRLLSGSMLLSSFLVIALVVLASVVYSLLQYQLSAFSIGLAAAMLAMTMTAPLQLLREFCRRWLLANLQIRASTFYEVSFSLAFLSVLAVLLFAGKLTAVMVFWGIAVVNVVGLGIWWYAYRDHFRFSRPQTKKQISDNFRYGKWVAGENICSTITTYFCVWLLAQNVSEDASGVFFACFTVVLLANPFLLGVSGILAPRAAQGFYQEGWPGLLRILSKYLALILFVMTSLSIVMWFYGDQLTTLFFGQKYAAFFDKNFDGKNSTTAILGLSLPFLGTSFTLTCGLLAANRPFDTFCSALIGLVVLVAMTFFSRSINLESMAVSFVTSIVATMLARLAFLSRAYLATPKVAFE